MRKKLGQSVLEYVIVLTVIVAAIAFGANSFLKKAMVTGINDTANSIMDATSRLPGANTTATPAPTPAPTPG